MLPIGWAYLIAYTYTGAGLSSTITPGAHGGVSLQHTQAVFLIQIMDSAFIVSTQSLTLQPRQRTRLLGFHMRLLRRLRQHVKTTERQTTSVSVANGKRQNHNSAEQQATQRQNAKPTQGNEDNTSNMKTSK